MLKISKMYQNTTFLLEGNGEEHGDIWRRYFENGKSYRETPVIQYLPFSSGKLI